MSEPTPVSSTPPPPPPPPPAAPAAAATGGGGAGKIIAGGIGAVLVGGAAVAGVVGYNTLSGGGAQPADAMPSDFQMYARIDLDPGASQKIDLFKLLNRVPELKDLIGVEDPNKADIREMLFEEITQECPEINYADDIEPWLGDRVGIGGSVTDVQNEEFDFLIAVQVKDESKAEEGVAALFDCGGSDYGIAFYEGYALLSPDQASVDDMLERTKKESLAQNESFAEAMDALGEKGVASAWFDTEGFIDIFAEIPGFIDEIPAEQRAELEEIGSMAVAIRVDGSAIELAGASSEEVDQFDGRSNIADLPEDTVAAISISGMGQAVEDQWDLFLQTFESEFSTFEEDFGDFNDDFDDDFGDFDDEFGFDDDFGGFDDDYSFDMPTPEEMIEAFEAETGLALPDDLVALLGETFTLAIGSANLETIPMMQGPDDLEKLEIAIHTTDRDETESIDVMRKLADLAAQAGIPLVAEESDGGAVLATGETAAKKVAEGGDLGKSDRFKSVMPFGADATFAFYLDFTTAIEKLLAADPPPSVRDFVSEIEFIDAIGMSAGNVDGHGKFSLRVNFAD